MPENSKIIIPTASILSKDTEAVDYADSFSSAFNHVGPIDSAAMGKAFFSGGPKWVEKLFSFRNHLVKFFGLKVSDAGLDRQAQLRNFKCEPGDRMGLFKVFDRTANEVVLGEDDKHLDFRVSLLLEELTSDTKKLTITTTVVFHNWFGKLYFLPVRLFHKRIVPSMLKSMVKEIQNP